MTLDWWQIGIAVAVLLIAGLMVGYAWGYKDRSRKWR